MYLQEEKIQSDKGFDLEKQQMDLNKQIAEKKFGIDIMTQRKDQEHIVSEAEKQRAHEKQLAKMKPKPTSK